MEATEFARAIEPWSDADARNITSRLALAVRHAIKSGLLQSGDRLPPERALASALNVSRPTISAVMLDLRSSGLVASRQGSGTWIAESPPHQAAPIPFFELIQQPGLIDLAAATAPDASMLPRFRLDASDLLAADPANGLSPVGLPSLREDIATRLRRWSPRVRADDVIVTSGAHQALALLVASLVPRGAAVLVEDVTYGGLIDIVQANGGHVIGVERDADGPRPDSLRTMIERHQPAMTVLVSSVHSPSGVISSDQRNTEIAQVLARTESHVVIDETYADLEFKPSSRSLTTLLGGRAILVGSLSKTAWLGLRTGWLATPRPDLTKTVARRRWSQFDLGPSVPSQLVARHVLARLDDLIARRRAMLIERATWLTRNLDDTFPNWELTPVAGGLALWARLPGRDSSAFVSNAAEQGVAVLPGSACRADRAVDPHVRICFDRPITVLEEALSRLGHASPDASR